MDTPPGLRRHPRRRPLFLWLAAIGSLGLVAAVVSLGLLHFEGQRSAGCSIPPAQVSWQQLICHAEAGLLYPGATVEVKQGAVEQDCGTSGPAGPDKGAIAWTSSSPEQVESWYETWLSAHGWRLSNDSQNSGGDFTAGLGFRRGSREYFSVDIMNRQNLSLDYSLPALPVTGTVFESDYTIDPGPSVHAGLGCLI